MWNQPYAEVGGSQSEVIDVLIVEMAYSLVPGVVEVPAISEGESVVVWNRNMTHLQQKDESCFNAVEIEDS